MTDILFGSFVLIALVLILTIMVVFARATLMPQKAVTLAINGQTAFETKSGQKLLSALSDHNILIPSACAGAGTCGLCRVRITNGGPDSLPLEAGHFTKTELRDGHHLACQVVVRGDMEVEVAEDLLGAEVFICEVASSRQLTPLIREIVLQLPGGVHPDVFAGSFVQVTAAPFALKYKDIEVPQDYDEVWRSLRGLSVESRKEVTRAYSISNRPQDTEAGRLVLNIRLALPPPSVPTAPPGIVSSWLFSLRPMDMILLSGPFGTFRVQPTDREMVFIGGGVGMAPLRAMIYDQLERTHTTRKMSFWYGARSKVELLYSAEFDELAAKNSNFDWTVALSDPRPEDNWNGTVGFVHSIVFEKHLRNHPAPENCEYYLCGPPLMIKAVLSMLDDLGVDSDNIFNDDFGV